MEVNEEYGLEVHAIITVKDLHEYLQGKEEYKDVLARMEAYMEQYCVL